jgi:hypothetical protein
MVRLRVERAIACGCDGIVAPPTTSPAVPAAREGRKTAFATQGVRLADTKADGRECPGSPDQATAAGRTTWSSARDRRSAILPLTTNDMHRGAERRVLIDKLQQNAILAMS